MYRPSNHRSCHSDPVGVLSPTRACGERVEPHAGGGGTASLQDKKFEPHSIDVSSGNGAQHQALSMTPHSFIAPNDMPTPDLEDHNDSSTSLLDNTLSGEAASIWIQAQGRIAALRNAILILRIDVSRERDICKQQEETVEKIMDTFMATLDIAMSQPSNLSFQGQFKDLASRLKSARLELKIAREKRGAIEDRLSGQEYNLTELETDIYATLKADAVDGTKTTSQDIDATRPQSISSAHQEWENTPAPLNELYDRMSDLRILFDRLGDFEEGLREELDEREMLRATGQLNISSDEQFFQESRIQRLGLEKEFEQAQADVHRLKQLCSSMGIQYEDVQFSTSPQLEKADSTSNITMHDESGFHTDATTGSSSVLIDTFYEARERVRNWLRIRSNSEEPRTGIHEWEIDNQVNEARSDAGWEFMPDHPDPRRPLPDIAVEAPISSEHMPEWISGPLPGSTNIAQLLQESTAEDDTATQSATQNDSK